MRKKPSKEKYVTEVVFKKEMKVIHMEFKGVHDEIKGIHAEFKGVHDEIKGIHAEFKGVHEDINGLDQKINNVAHELVQYNQRLERVENTMATKTDTNLILEKIDHVLKKISIFDQEESVQSLHLNEVRHQVDDHEKRLLVLESSR